MAKRKLTREELQAYLKASDADGGITQAPVGNKKSQRAQRKLKRKLKDRKKGSGGNSKRPGGTVLTRVTGAFTGTIADRLSAEVQSSDFKNHLTAFIFGIVLAALVLVGLSSDASFPQSVRDSTYDLKMKSRLVQPPKSQHIVHVDIDDKSISSVGRFPWKREVWASVVRASSDAGVKRLVFDVEFFDRQPEELDKAAYDELSDFRNVLGRELESFSNYVAETFQAFKDALDSNGADATELLTQIEDLKESVDQAPVKEIADKMSRLRGSFSQLSRKFEEQIDETIQLNPVQSLTTRFAELHELVLIDHDELFADAMRAAGNVYMPLHFSDSNSLTRATRNVEWSEELVTEIFRRFKEIAETSPSGLNGISRSSFVDILAEQEGLTYKDRNKDEGEKPIDRTWAQHTADEEFNSIQQLYCYRMIHQWYFDRRAALIKQAGGDKAEGERLYQLEVHRHMAAYVDDWEGAIAARARTGGPLEHIKKRDLNKVQSWTSASKEQLHKFYSNYKFRYGSSHISEEGGVQRVVFDRPWTLPISVIQGYDSAEYDPWGVRQGAQIEGGNSKGLFHYRDVQLETAIFRLFNVAAGTGYVSINPDRDGILRRVPLVVVYHEPVTGEAVVVPQLALMTLFEDLHVDHSTVRVMPGDAIEFEANEKLVDWLANQPAKVLRAQPEPEGPAEMRTFRIAVDDRCAMQINWYGNSDTELTDVFDHLPVAMLVDVGMSQQIIRDNRMALPDMTDQLKRNLMRAEFVRTRGPITTSETLQKVCQVPLNDVFDAVRSLSELDETRSLELLEEMQKIHLELWEHYADELQLAWDQEAHEADEAPVLFVRGKPTMGQELTDALEALRTLLLQKLGLDPLLVGEELGAALEALPGNADYQKFEALLSSAESEFQKPFSNTTIKALMSINRGPNKSTLPAKHQLDASEQGELLDILFNVLFHLSDPEFQLEHERSRLNQLCMKNYGVVATQVDEASFPGPHKVLEFALATFERATEVRELMLNADYTMAASHPSATTEREVLDESGKAVFVRPLEAERMLRNIAWESERLLKIGLLNNDDQVMKLLAKVKESDFSLDTPEALELLGMGNFEFDPITLTLRSYRSEHDRVVKLIEKQKAERETTLKRLRPLLEGRFALIGAAATGLGDLVPTAVHPRTPGPTLHTNTYNTMLHSMEPIRTAWLTYLIGGFLIMIVSITAARFSLTWSIGVAVTALGGYYLFDAWVLMSIFDRDVATPAIMISPVVSFLSIESYRFAVEYRDKIKIKRQFGKYLAPELIEEMQKNPDALRLGGDEREATVFFSDIAGFTPISESMSAPRLVDFLNQYMTRVCEPIRESQGTIDKFIGDAVMAIWGAPVSMPDYSARGIKTAVRVSQELHRMNQERRQKGELGIGTRIGLATGTMVVGNMGTEYKQNFTCIGDTVNLGARLEAANKQYGTQIMVNDLCFKQAKDIVVGHVLDCIAVKGKSKGVPVYHVIGLIGEAEPDHVEGSEMYTTAFELYQKEKWSEALDLFRKAKPLLPPPYDVKLGPCDHMIDRCEQLVVADRDERMNILKLKSVDEEWDGVWRLTSK